MHPPLYDPAAAGPTPRARSQQIFTLATMCSIYYGNQFTIKIHTLYLQLPPYQRKLGIFLHQKILYYIFQRSIRNKLPLLRYTVSFLVRPFSAGRLI